MKHWKRLSCAVLTILVLATVGVLIGAQNSHANPLGGDSDDSNVGKCGSGGTNCTSWGITWVQQPLDEFLASAERVGLTSQQKQDMINACAGMANPVVNRLAYVDFANGGKIQLDSVSGLISNDRADRNNAIYVDPSTIPGGMSAAEAQRLFEYALSIGVDMQYNWNQMAIFAFDQAWTTCGTDAACLNNLITQQAEEAEKNGDGSSVTPYFQSKTVIDVGNGIPEGPQDSGWDGHVQVEFSTDEPSVTVNFTHTLNYQPNGFSISGNDQFTTSKSAGVIDSPPAKDDVADNVNNHTSYSITTGGGGDSGRYTTSEGSQTFNASQTVSLSPGETKTVCSYINYGQKFHNIKSKKHVTQKYKAEVKADPAKGIAGSPEVPEISHYDWYWAGPSGSGSSGACATITRPSDPTGSPKNPNASGTTTSDIMFAGETTALEWDLHANTWDVRRLKERQITAHLVNALPGHSGRYFSGTSRSSRSPYDYYWTSNIERRHNFGEEGASLDGPDAYGKIFGVVVPDHVGYKYCHTGGYRYESWYSINGSWKHDTRTDKNYRNYWYVYDASCRTIAKKPSVAIWNGSLLANGGITTSTSPRYDSAAMGVRAEHGGPQTLYGSWSEYLASVGRNVNFFSSGASFAIGSKTLSAPRSTPFDSSNSPLTIANNSHLGGSGIYNNSTYRTRLTTFLENQATYISGDTLGAMNNVSNTQILRRDGNLKITGNITTNPGNYSSIYHIPQVVIFVHGDLEIASDVTQIDAWLIVDGTINTCSEFVSRVTESDAPNRLSNTCTKQLAFNGPVLANGLILNRSFGSDPVVPRTGVFGAAPAKQNAGEIFNLRMDTYLWAYAQANRYASSYTEGYTRELAPRY